MKTLPLDFKNPKEFELKEVKIKDISQISVEAWEIQLCGENSDKSIRIIVDVGQITSALFGLSKMNKLALSPSVYQFIRDLCNYTKIEIKSIIIDSVEEEISKSKVELKDKENLIYFDISSGDAIALALVSEVPIYTISNLLKEDQEENEIEIILD